MNPIVSFAQADQQYQQALKAGAVAPDTTMQGFAQMMSQITGKPEYMDYADDSWIGNLAKRGSARLDKELNMTGLPQGAEWLGTKVGEMVGVENPEQVGEMTRGLPRAAVNMAPMMIPGPGWVTAAGMGTTALLSGADAYEKTDDLGSAALAGATPWAATKLFGLGGKAAMQGVAKIPGAKALGFKGGETVVSKAVAEGVETTSEQLFAKTLQDRVSHYVGGQVAAGGAFFAKDAIEMGEKAFTPEFLLGTVLNQAGFLPFDVAGLVKPHAVGKSKITGERSLEKSEIESEHTAAQKAKTNYMIEKAENPSALNDMLLKRKYGLDIAESFANESRLRAIQEVVKNEKEALDDSFKGTVNRLKQEGFWPENLTVDALIEKPELGNEFVQTAVKEYKDKLAGIEKNAKDTVTPLDTLSLFGVAIEELGLDPAGRFVQTPLAARDAKLFREQFQGKLTEQQIGDLWLRHQVEKGDLPPDMTQFPGYVPKLVETKPVKAPKPEKKAADVAKKAEAAAKTPEAKAAAKAAKEAVKAGKGLSPEDKKLLKLAALAASPDKDFVSEISKLTQFKHFATPEGEAMLHAEMAEATANLKGRTWDPVSKSVVPDTAPPIEQAVAAASAIKVEHGVTPSQPELAKGVAKSLEAGATHEEAGETSLNKLANAADNGNLKPLGQLTPSNAEKLVKAAKTVAENEAAQAKDEATLATLGGEIANILGDLFTPKAGIAADPKADAYAAADATKALISKISEYVMIKIRSLFRTHVTMRIDRAAVEQLRNEVLSEVMPGLKATAEEKEAKLAEFGLSSEELYQIIKIRMSTEGLSSSEKGKTLLMTDADVRKGFWSDKFSKAMLPRVKGQEGDVPLDLNVTKEIYMGSIFEKETLKNMNPTQGEYAKKIVIARETGAKVSKEELAVELGLDLMDPNTDFLLNQISQSMSVFEKNAQINAIIDGTTQFNKLFLPDEKGVSGVDSFITNEQRRQGLTMKDSASLQQELINQFYNWMHRGKYWFDATTGRVDMQSVKVFGADGNPVSPELKAQIDAQVKVSIEAASKMKAVQGKKANDGKVESGFLAKLMEFELSSIDPTLSFSIDTGRLLTPFERVTRLKNAFRTTIQNHTTAEFTPIDLTDPAGNKVHFVAESVEILPMEVKDPYYDKDAEVQTNALPEPPITRSSADYPPALLDMVELLKKENPESVYTISTNPRKRTLLKKSFLERIKATPGVTKERLAEVTANPESWPGVKVNGEKVTFSEWIVSKAKNPGLTSVESLVNGIESTALAENSKQTGVNLAESYKAINDKDVQKGIEILGNLKNSEFVDSEGSIGLISEVLNEAFNGELTAGQRKDLFEALLPFDPVLVEEYVGKLKLDQKIKDSVLLNYKSMKNLEEAKGKINTEFFSNEMKLNLVGEQVAGMMAAWGVAQSDATAIMKLATPEIKLALFSALRESNPFAGLADFNRNLDLKIWNARNEVQLSKVRVTAIQVREAMLSLADLVSGRSKEPVELGGIIISNFDYQTPYRKYILSGKTEPYRQGQQQPSTYGPRPETRDLSDAVTELVEGKKDFTEGELRLIEEARMGRSSSEKKIDNYPFLDALIRMERDRIELAPASEKGTPEYQEAVKNPQYKKLMKDLAKARASAKLLNDLYLQRTSVTFAATTPLRAALRGAESQIDRIVTPEVLAEHIFDELGIPLENRETYIRDFARIIELSRVDDIGFGTLLDDINAGVLGGAVTNKREIYLSALKQLAAKDRVKSQHFVLAHELGHIIEADAREGRYGQVAQEAFLKADVWIRDADTQTLADAMDVLYNGLLPEEFRNTASLEVSKNLSPSEFFANASAFHRLSLLKDGNEMVNTLLPTPLRSAFDWLVGHFHRLTKGLKMFNGARRKFEAHQLNTNLLKSLEKIRLSNRKAEENNDTGYRMLIASSGDLAQIRTSSMEFVDASVENAPGGKEWVDLARGNFNDVKESVGRGASRWFERLEDFSRRYPFVAPLFAAMRDAPSAVMAGITNSMMPILGEGGVNGVKVMDKEWSKIAQSPKMTESLRVIEQTAQMEGVNPVVEDPTTGVMKVDLKLLTAEGRAAFNRLSPLEKSNIEKYMIQRVTSMKSNAKMLIQAEHEGAMFEVSTLLSSMASYQGKFHEATRDGHFLYTAIRDGVLTEAYRLGSKLTDAEFQSALQFVQARLDFVKTRQEAFAANPFHLTFRRFGAINAEFTHPTKGAINLPFESKDDLRKTESKMKEAGYSLVKSSVVEKQYQNRMRINENGREWQVIRKKEEALKTMLENMPIDPESKKGILDSMNFSEALTKTLASESYGFGAGRKFTEGYEKQNPINQHMKYIEMTQRIAHRRLMNAATQHHFRAPEFLEHPEVKQQMEEGLSNFMTPDSAVGSALNKANAVMFIGGNIASHFSEFMQPINTLLPEWVAMGGGYYNGVRQIGKFSKELANVYRKAFGAKFIKGDKGDFDSTHFARHFKDPDHVALITEAERRGRFNYGHQTENFERLGEQQEKIRKVMEGGKDSFVDIATRPLHWWAKTSMGFYGKFTQHNELMGLLMGYESAKARGMGKQEAIEEALNFSTSVNKSGGRAGRQVAPWSGSKMIGHIFYALQGYTTGWFSQLGRYYLHGYKDHPGVTPKNRENAKKAFQWMLGAQMATAGVLGLPFMGAMLTLMEDFTGEDIKGTMFKALDEVTNDPNITDMAANGVANHILRGLGMPVDVHSRFAMGGLMGFNEYDGFSSGSLMGPTGSMVEGLWKMGKTLYQEQNFAKAFREGGPVATKRLLEMYENDGKIMAGGQNLKQLEGMEKFTYGMGFQNAEVSKLRSAARMVRNASDRDTAAMQAAAGRLGKVMNAGPAIAKAALYKEAEAIVPVSIVGRERQMMVEQTVKTLVEKVASNEMQKNSPADFRQGANARVAATVKPTLSAMGTPIPQSSKLQQLQGADAVFAMFGMPKVRNASTYRNAAMLDQMRQQDPLMFQSEAQY